ncbi:hypothetical protein GIB67_033818 [Kingdonia uniflora]|uniref:Cytochrome b5 heme-binding domain-containing protein n=1 Tax=Kingdonia uniflora TaxID=39325 RepID=A0A7J7LI89_9MAGN|nr:hypothetical protein GIB67_033818 [Kingdonia uniflora]
MAIKYNIYDVSRLRIFYGPGEPYSLFMGKDTSRALAHMSFDSKDLTGNLDGLSSSELEVLQDWEFKFMEKYVKVGQIVSERIVFKNKGSEREAEDVSQDTNEKRTESEGALI